MKTSISLTQWLSSLLCTLVLLGTVSCSSEPANDAPLVPATVDPAFAISSEPNTQVSAKDRGRICRAFDADMGGYDPKIVQVVSDNGTIARTRYARPDDGKIWTRECRLDRNRIIWRTVDVDGPRSGLGPWRNRLTDETITFELKGDSVVIRTDWQDGSSSTNSYQVK